MIRHRRGFALLLVLWTLVPVSILFLTLSGVARSDSHLTFNLRDAAKLQAAADGGINTAVFALLRSAAGTAPLRLNVGDATVAVRVTSLGGLVNPNNAAPELLRALLIRVGADPAQADRLAAAIVDWRAPGQQTRPGAPRAPAYQAAGLGYGPPGAPFETVDELREVLGMTPALFAALRPNLTLFNDHPPDPAIAPSAVRAALGDIGTPPRPPQAGNIFRISAAALAPDGARIMREAVIRFGPSNNRAWRVLSWETVPGD